VVEHRGPVTLLAPFLQWHLRRTIRSDMERLKRILEEAPQVE
jgi:hypothetical protein